MDKLEYAKRSMNEFEKGREELVKNYREAEDKYILTKDELEEDSEELKKLKGEMRKFELELRDVRRNFKDWSGEYIRLKGAKKVNITHHAVVQYLDREKHFDIKKIREEVTNKLFKEGKIKSKTKKIKESMIVRHLKREGKINMEEIRDYLLPDDLKEKILEEELVGASKTYTLKSGFRIVTNGGNIVTFLPRKAKQSKKKKYRSKRDKRKPRKMKL